MKSLLLYCFLAFGWALFAQTDPVAMKVLDTFSSKASSAPSVSLKFNLITVSQMDKTSDTTSGSLVMMKDQYRLDLAESTTWFNGTTSWNLLIPEKEVTITKPDKKDNSFLTRPSALFTLYKTGYKTRLVEEDVNKWIIDLYPEATETEIVRIRLLIAKTTYNLLGAEYKRKDGVSVFLVVKDYNTKNKPDPSSFIFNPGNHKGIEIIDMR